MTWRDTVLWNEGMLMQPQHFQQQERHWEHRLHAAISSVQGYHWGFTELELDAASLSVGKLALQKAVGVFPDGTAFNMPAIDPLPDPIQLDPSERDYVVNLCLPMRRPGGVDSNIEASESSQIMLARHLVAEENISDSNSPEQRDALLQVGRLNTRLLSQKQSNAAWLSVGVAKVIEVRNDGQVLLHRPFIPPNVDARQEQTLRVFLDEITGLLNQRGQVLAARVSGTQQSSAVAEIADFLLLQTVNRFAPVFTHFGKASRLHPVRFFEWALSLAGDLATFRDTRRAAEFAPYVHDDLEVSFTPLMADLRRSLSMVLEQSAISIPLQERKFGVRVAQISDVDLLRNASFVLAIKASMPNEALRGRFPTQTKIGPVERIRDLVNLQLPGVRLESLAVAPRQIPYHSGAVYFELQTRSEDLWKQLEQSGGLAMHIAGEFPGLEMSFWAVRY